MVPTSVSQIIEALGKLIIGLALAWYLMKIGAGSAKAAAGAIFGVTAGAGISLVYLIFTHLSRRMRESGTACDVPDSSSKILKRLLAIAIPITIGASVVPITTWLDTYQVQTILRGVLDTKPAEWYLANQVTDPVVAMYGAYHHITVMGKEQVPSDHMYDITGSICENDRKNLYFEVQKPDDKFKALIKFLKDKKNKVGIIYCSTRKTVEDICDRLCEAGYNATRYHAGLGD
jgi:stage V sporulation protein B